MHAKGAMGEVAVEIVWSGENLIVPCYTFLPLQVFLVAYCIFY